MSSTGSPFSEEEVKRTSWTEAIREDFLEEGETAFEGRGRKFALARNPPLGTFVVPGGIVPLDQG